MVSLTRTKAHELLAQICQNDSALCSHIKLLVLLKRSGRLNIFYSDGDLSAQSTQTVAGGVRMGTIITQVTCGPYNECNSG